MCPTFLQLKHFFSALGLSCSALDNHLPLALPAGLMVVAVSDTASVFFGFLGPRFRFCTLAPVVVIGQKILMRCVRGEHITHYCTTSRYM